MRIPNPKAVTTTEAYLAYKAEVLEQSELKDKLYHPYLHIDGWLAYWTGLTSDYPTDKNGDPECLTDEEAYIAYLAGVASEYPEAIKDPADVRVASYLKYLISARFGRPDYPVTREEFYLSMMKPRFIPSGDPSSEVELDGTVEAPFVDVKMYGDSFQQIYSGKNLITFGNYSYNSAGIQLTRNGNTLTAVGTLTSNVSERFFDTGNVELNAPIPAGTYTMSMAGLASKDLLVSLRRVVDGASVGVTNFVIQAGQTSATITIDYDATHYRAAIQGLVQNEAIDVTFENIQVEAGSTATSYEPYVGGVPAPSPDYPQDVNVVTGRQVVDVRGKNLYYLDTAPHFSSNEAYIDVDYGLNDITIEAIGTGGAQYAGAATTELDPTKTYTLSGTATKIAETSNTRVSYWTSNDGSTWSSSTIVFTQALNAGQTYNFSFQVTGYKYYRFGFYNANTATVTLGTKTKYTNIQLEEGSTATDYQPYQSQSYEINLGKNLFDGILDVGIINGSSGLDQPNTNYIRARNFIPVKELTRYTISCLDARVVGIFIYEYKGDFSYNLTINKSVSNGSAFTTDPGTKYVRFRPNLQTVDTSIKFQFEVGTTATDYAPYFTPIELCKIGDYQDYIYKSGDDWYVHKDCGKVVLDGSESWSYANNSYFHTALANALIITNTGELSPIISNYYLSSTPTSIYNGTVSYGISLNNSTARVRIRNKDFTTTSDFKNWLGSNNTTVYYALATQTDTQITDENLLTQLDALKEGGSYNDKTYITVSATDPNLPGLLYVEAAV